MACDFIRPGARFNDLPHSMRARKPLHHRYRAVDMRSYNRLLQTYVYLSTVLAWSNTNEHLSSPSVFSGVRVTRSLVLCVCFVDLCLSFCTFSFGHCFVCSSIYGFFGIFKLFLFKMYMFRFGEFIFRHGLGYIVEQLSAVIITYETFFYSR